MAQMITGQLMFCNNRAENYHPVYLSADCDPMGIKETRLNRLKELIATRFDGVALRLASALDMKPPQVHRWISGNQGIHEDSARMIETKLGLVPHWLDGATGSTILLTSFEESLVNNLRQLPKAEQELLAAECYRRAAFWVQISEGIKPPEKPEPTTQ